MKYNAYEDAAICQLYQESVIRKRNPDWNLIMYQMNKIRPDLTDEKEAYTISQLRNRRQRLHQKGPKKKMVCCKCGMLARGHSCTKNMHYVKGKVETIINLSLRNYKKIDKLPDDITFEVETNEESAAVNIEAEDEEAQEIEESAAVEIEEAKVEEVQEIETGIEKENQPLLAILATEDYEACLQPDRAYIKMFLDTNAFIDNGGAG